MNRKIVLAAALLCAACTSQQLTDTGMKIDTTVASAQPTVEMLCWGVSAADAVFKTTYAAGPSADPAVVADEAKAVASSVPICANPPANLVQAVADLAAVYKSIQQATPAAVASVPAKAAS